REHAEAVEAPVGAPGAAARVAWHGARVGPPRAHDPVQRLLLPLAGGGRALRHRARLPAAGGPAGAAGAAPGRPGWAAARPRLPAPARRAGRDRRAALRRVGRALRCVAGADPAPGPLVRPRRAARRAAPPGEGVRRALRPARRAGGAARRPAAVPGP